MSADLHALLARASDEIEGGAPALDGGRLGVVRSAARRRRIVRHTAESFAGVGVVGVLGVGLWFGLGQQAPEPVVPIETPTVSPSPSPSDTPTPTPTPTSTPTPTGPPTRAEEIDDATVIERLSAPRTGEVWHTPERTPEMDEVLALADGYFTPTIYRVGSRADAVIYMSVAEGGMPWSTLEFGALYEIDEAGARLIACPSARTGDECAGSAEQTGGVVRDDETFYDSLTMPESIDIDGYVVTTSHARSDEFASLFGDAQALTPEPLASRTLLQLGALSVVERTQQSAVAGLVNIEFGVATPFGTFLELSREDLPAGEFEAIRWDDGVRRGASHGPDGDDSYVGSDPADYTAVTLAPGSSNCTSWHFSRASTHDPAQWRAAGTTPGGYRVYLPLPGGSSLTQAVRAWQEESSWLPSEMTDDPAADEYGTLHGAAAGYEYTTDQAFLDANALFAVQGPAGEWMLGMRSDAVNVVYECS
ncbi:hypothetical protein [Cellulomonas sp. P5_C5]